MKFEINNAKWINPPAEYSAGENSLSFRTEPDTDLWQRTYYGFRHDNSHALLVEADYNFTFSVNCAFKYEGRFEQCGLLIYIDKDNWCKASVEYENASFSRLGSVVTNNGYSDWASFDIGTVDKISFRLSRRGPDFLIESAFDGEDYKQMRIFHMHALGETSAALGASRLPLFEAQPVSFGLCACSPLDSSFEAEFSDINIGECIWEAHG